MRLSLRSRIFAACFGIGAGIAVFFGGLSLVLLELMEFEQVDVILAEEMRGFIDAHATHASSASPRATFIDAWAVPLPSLEGLPEPLKALAPGTSEVDEGGRERRVAVADRGPTRFVVAIDMSLMEPWENHVTGAVVVLVALCTLLCALIGRWLAELVVSPVVRLADRVAAAPSDPAACENPQSLASGFGDDEAGQLARALDRYSQLLIASAQREREFTAQASHELRTPVAVTATSLELVLADATLAPRSRAQLERAARALAWMTETLEALMVLARAQHDAGTDRRADLTGIVREVLQGVEPGLAVKPVTLECDPCEGVSVAAHPGALRTVVRNLLANACANTSSGRIRVQFDDRRLAVSDTGHGLDSGDGPRLFEPFQRGANAREPGEGLGLAIVRRICEHYAWQVSLTSNDRGGVDAVVHFHPGPRA